MGVVTAQGQQLLREVADELEATRTACFLLDADLTLQWASSEMHAMMRATPDELGCGQHIFNAISRPAWSRRVTPKSLASAGERLLPYALAHAENTSQPVLPEIMSRAAAVGVEPTAPPAMWTGMLEYVEDDHGTVVPARYSVTMLGHPEEGWIGVAVVIGSALRATVLDLLTRGDEQLFERVASLATPRQEPAAVLFVDIEDSTALSKHLSTPAYFALIRRVLSAVDGEISQRDGVVGKHAGDGATAFFRASDAGSASRAARNAIETAFALQTLARGLEQESPLRLNIGLHFAPRLYLGQLITSGRLEVTALGDEVNETARIQESSRGGTVLATKLLVEQLDPEDADVVGLRPEAVTYTALGDWPTCSAKARRDAASVPVTELVALVTS
ncbi:MAG: adenylate cyclase [Actinomycetota bacterium]|nr:adenylate cyclase [Actinomycetota bacterium]